LVLTKPHQQIVRLLLRQFTNEDVHDLSGLDSESEVLRYVNPKNQGRDMILQERIPWLQQVYQLSGGRFGYWVAIEKISSEFIGWFVLMPPTPKQLAIAELGYRLKYSAWGKGYATEGAKALIQKSL
jgi:RimJ/RimL family protein N-acetyltransferase